MVQPLVVVNTGAVAPPNVKDGADEPLKLIVPVLVTASVPLAVAIVSELPKVTVPVLTVITSVSTTVLPIHVTLPVKEKVPEVTSIFATRLVVAFVPEKTRLPLTLQVPAPTSSNEVMEDAV